MYFDIKKLFIKHFRPPPNSAKALKNYEEASNR